MPDRWYVTRNGKARHGPFTRTKLQELAELGKLLPSDQVCPEDGTESAPADSLTWLFPDAEPPPSLVTDSPQEDRPRSRRVRSDEDDDEDRPRPRKKRRRGTDVGAKTLGPAIGLYATGVLALIYGVGNLIVQMGLNPNGPPLAAANEAERAGQLFGYYGVLFGLPLLPIPVLIGAFCLQTYRAYPMAMIGCILATIPCCSPCLVLGIPFGVWGLIVLNSDDVKAAFSNRE